jgi:hypothetical protein
LYVSFFAFTKQLLQLQQNSVSTGEWRAFRGLRSRKLQFGIAIGEGESTAGGLSTLVIGEMGAQGNGFANTAGGAYANGFGFATSPGIGSAFGGGIGSSSGNTTVVGGNTDPIRNMAFTFTNSGGAGRGIFGPGPAAVAEFENAKGGKNKDNEEDPLFDGGPFGGATGGGGGGFSYSNALGNGTGTSNTNGANAVFGQAYGNSQGAGIGYGGGSNSAGKAGGNAGGNTFGLGGGSFVSDLGTSTFTGAGGGYGTGSAGGYLGETLMTVPGYGGFGGN